MLDFIVDSTIAVTGLFIIIQMLYGVFYVGQLVIERFLLNTLPIIAEVIDRIKNPHNYK